MIRRTSVLYATPVISYVRTSVFPLGQKSNRVVGGSAWVMLAPTGSN